MEPIEMPVGSSLTIQDKGDRMENEPLEDRVSKLEQARGEIEDTLLVMAHLEAKQSKMLKDHTEWMERTEQSRREAEEKLNALISYVMKRDGFPEAGQSK